jgi:methylated-DNA-[protein]-cysteine S-methyltransferase
MLANINPLSRGCFRATGHTGRVLKSLLMSGPERVYATLASPVGKLTLTAARDGLTGISFEMSRGVRYLESAREDANDPLLRRAAQQLGEYFAGERRTFDLPLAIEGTEFQKRVWDQLLKIPFGRTRSYGEMAMLLGDPKCTRAVGLANGSNPVAIVVPCHRVVGASGSLVGFGGGLRNKALLLDLERGQPAFEFLTD